MRARDWAPIYRAPPCSPRLAMTAAVTEAVKTWWTSARAGRLSPRALAQVYALHKVSELRDLDLQHVETATMVTKVGGGHPSPAAIQQLRKTFDADPEWYPGKGGETRKRPGPKPVFSPQKSGTSQLAPWLCLGEVSRSRSRQCKPEQRNLVRTPRPTSHSTRSTS